MKWRATGGIYTFEIEEKHDGTFDIAVKSYLGTDHYWNKSLNAAKAFIRREFDGLTISRYERVTD